MKEEIKNISINNHEKFYTGSLVFKKYDNNRDAIIFKNESGVIATLTVNLVNADVGEGETFLNSNLIFDIGVLLNILKKSVSCGRNWVLVSIGVLFVS